LLIVDLMMKASSSRSGRFGFRRLSSSIWQAATNRCPMQKKPCDHLQWRDLQLQRAPSRATKQGHQFRTNSDTEVIIHGYKQWGMMSSSSQRHVWLAIWDVPNERLVVARDAMGIKLIYHKIDNGKLSFGSEIRSILAAGIRSRQ